MAIPISKLTVPGALPRHPDDPGDGEHQYKRKREQRVNRAVRDPILRQQRGDRKIHGEPRSSF